MSKFIKDSLILCAITLIAGLLLGAVYEITYDAREEQKEKAKIKAYQTVYSDASEFIELEEDMSPYVDYLDKNGISSKKVVLDGVVKALSSEGEVLGYIINVTSKEGFGGDISITVGVDNELKVKGVSILSINETPGLGMNAKNESFLNGYLVDRDGMFIVNKKDGESGANIDAISGATITTKAVTNGVNAAIVVAESILGGLMENGTEEVE